MSTRLVVTDTRCFSYTEAYDIFDASGKPRTDLITFFKDGEFRLVRKRKLIKFGGKIINC